jgi:hypothetical protein
VCIWASGCPRFPTTYSFLFLCCLTTNWLWLLSYFYGHYLLTADRGVSLLYWSLHFRRWNQISIIPNINAKKLLTLGFQIYAPSWITGQQEQCLTSRRSPPDQSKHSLTAPCPECTVVISAVTDFPTLLHAWYCLSPEITTGWYRFLWQLQSGQCVEALSSDCLTTCTVFIKIKETTWGTSYPTRNSALPMYTLKLLTWNAVKENNYVFKIEQFLQYNVLLVFPYISLTHSHSR